MKEQNKDRELFKAVLGDDTVYKDDLSLTENLDAVIQLICINNAIAHKTAKKIELEQPNLDAEDRAKLMFIGYFFAAMPNQRGTIKQELTLSPIELILSDDEREKLEAAIKDLGRKVSNIIPYSEDY